MLCSAPSGFRTPDPLIKRQPRPVHRGLPASVWVWSTDGNLLPDLRLLGHAGPRQSVAVRGRLAGEFRMSCDIVVTLSAPLCLGALNYPQTSRKMQKAPATIILLNEGGTHMTGLPVVEVSAMTGHLLASGASGAGGPIVGLFLVVLAIVCYFIPSGVAAIRQVPNLGSVVVINLFLGWTFIGWVVALAMAMRSRAHVPDESALQESGAKKCPDCAETVLANARVCKHCGYRFAPPADGKAQSKPTSQPRGKAQSKPTSQPRGKRQSKPTSQPRGKASKTREIGPQMNTPTSTNSLRRGDPVQILKTGHRLTGKTGKVVRVLNTGYVAVRVGLSEDAFRPNELKPKPEVQ
jgi:ribosomal protein L32